MQGASVRPVDRARRIEGVLRNGGWVEDRYFDRLLPDALRAKSESFWSSVHVAQTAARWLEAAGARQVLDVGAGVGKFCVVASLTTGRRTWGLERRGPLVAEARKLAQALRADVVMEEGDLRVVEPQRFDAFYFYNPFAEHLVDKYERIDDTLVCSVDEYLRDARTVERWLRAAKVGTVMVTHNGLGGRIPCTWRCEKEQRCGGNPLRLWVKHDDDPSTDAFIEVEDKLVPASLLATLARRAPHASLEEALVARLAEPERG